MPQSSTPIIPFYESEGPPQALPLLTYHTEMLCPALSFVLISSQKEITFFTLPLRGHTLTPSHVFATTSHGTTPIPPRAPTPKVVKLVSFTAEQFTLSSRASMYSSLSSMDSKDSKIPKLEGEVGRPGRGGYNLEMALNWDDDRFKNLKSFSSVEPWLQMCQNPVESWLASHWPVYVEYMLAGLLWFTAYKTLAQCLIPLYWPPHIYLSRNQAGQYVHLILVNQVPAPSTYVEAMLASEVRTAEVWLVGIIPAIMYSLRRPSGRPVCMAGQSVGLNLAYQLFSIDLWVLGWPLCRSQAGRLVGISL
ncbi:hypothetical protein DFH29DRAFT_874528 [Suillus ampliporus]|nr:hypothetical protein DFH29DRAFT_874528 [Suillus ampliporus]